MSSDDVERAWTIINLEYSYYQRQLAEWYGDDKADEMMAQLYSEVWLPILAEVPGELLRSAVIQYVGRGNPYFPRAGELREIAYDLLDLINGNTQTAYSGWNEVMQRMKAVCRFSALPGWNDKTAMDALETIGGMQAVRFSDVKSLPYLMAQFVKSYNVIAGRARDHARMLPAAREVVAELAARRSIEFALDGPCSDDAS